MYPEKLTQAGRKQVQQQQLILHKSHFNPFTPELPVPFHVPSTTCNVISFNGQGQLCLLTCAVIKEIFQNHTRMRTI